MEDFKAWIANLESALKARGYANPRVLLKKHFRSLRYLYTQEESVDDVLLHYFDDLVADKKREYVEKLRAKRDVVSHADAIAYQGRIIKRCPKGTTRVGNSCAPYRAQLQARPKRPLRKPAESQAQRQIAKLTKAKSAKDVHQAYNIDKNRDRKTPNPPKV
jgi:hypothetical protein